MKITFLAPLHKISGGVRVILIYADLLSKRGHDVTVVAQNRNFLRRRFANFLRLKPSWMKNLRSNVLRVADYQEKNIPESDAIVVSSWKDAFLAEQYSQKVGAKFYLVQHDERLYHGPADKVGQAFRLSFKKIVVSSWLKEIFEKEFDQKAELLLNTVDRNLFHPVTAKKNESEIKILLLHHNYEWKGTREGAQIVQHLKEKYPQVKLIMFGSRNKKIDIPCDEYYYNLAQEKLAWLYSSSDIFLCPSWDEGFGLPSLEAMACGLAVVTYDNGGSRDFAFDPHASRGAGVDGQTAFVAPRRDKEALYQRLELAVGDENLREKIAQAGYEFSQKMPSWEEQTEKLERIFKNP